MEISVISGSSIGALLVTYFKNYKFIPIAIALSIVIGCMAFQAGNITGAALGVGLVLKWPQEFSVLLICGVSSLALLFGSPRMLINILGLLVASMAVIFLVIAIYLKPDISNLLTGMVMFKFPLNSEIAIMALLGTTIVPYNLFLGSQLSLGRDRRMSRIGLITSISLGGLISISILLVGMISKQPFSFEALSEALYLKVGKWSTFMLAIGMSSAGITSSLTAPLAAILTLKSILPFQDRFQNKRSIYYILVWSTVMLVGLFFAMLGIRPVSLIVFAQAANGIILPFTVIFILLLVIEHRSRVREKLYFKSFTVVIVTWNIVAIGAYNLFQLIFGPGLHGIIICFSLSIAIVSVAILISRRKMIG